MQIPSHAVQIWLTTDDQIMVAYPDGQQIPVPCHMNLLRNILKCQANKETGVGKLLTFRREFQAAFTHEDIVKKGAEVRAKHARKREGELERTALRKEREKRQRLKRVAERDKLNAANELLSLVGL